MDYCRTNLGIPPSTRLLAFRCETTLSKPSGVPRGSAAALSGGEADSSPARHRPGAKDPTLALALLAGPVAPQQKTHSILWKTSLFLKIQRLRNAARTYSDGPFWSRRKHAGGHEPLWEHRRTLECLQSRRSPKCSHTLERFEFLNERSRRENVSRSVLPPFGMLSQTYGKNRGWGGGGGEL